MTLTLPVALAVLCAALLHASWNAMVKGSDDPLADLALLNLAAGALALPALLALPPLPAASWPFVAGSIVIHLGYYATLIATYRHADLGVGYPLMRGSAPLLVALLGVAAFDEQPSASGWAGIGLISAGLLSLAWHQRRRAGAAQAVLYALANAALIACYTWVDASGARRGGEPLSYVAWLFALNALPLTALVARLRGPRALALQAGRRWRIALGGGACSALAYAIAVWATTRAPVAMVSALRETSVVFALGIGTWLLRERLSPQRWAAVAAVAAGAVTLKL